MNRECKSGGSENCVYPYCACYPKDDESVHALMSRDEARAAEDINPMHHFADPRPPIVRVQRYVCGFAMDPDNVLLLTKAKPDWQAGKLNGIGGKVEPTDTGLRYAMEREFLEETHVHIRTYNWTLFHTERFGAYGAPIDENGCMRDMRNGAPSSNERINTEVYFFYARVGPGIMKEACEYTARSEEPCSVHPWRDIGEPIEMPPGPSCIANLPYLLRAAAHYWQNMVNGEEWRNASPFIGKDVML